MEIKKTAEEIYQNNVKHGFWDKERNFGEMLMLVTSELAECLEADRKNRSADLDAFEKRLKELESTPALAEHLGVKDPFKHCFEQFIKDTYEDELADAIIRLLDISHGLTVDIEKHIELKMKYNSMRERMHGKKY